jgi:hypothetical protein
VSLPPKLFIESFESGQRNIFGGVLTRDGGNDCNDGHFCEFVEP